MEKPMKVPLDSRHGGTRGSQRHGPAPASRRRSAIHWPSIGRWEGAFTEHLGLSKGLVEMNGQFDPNDPNIGPLPSDYFGADPWEEDRG